MSKTYSVQERNLMFQTSTRQNIQMLPSQNVVGGATSMQYHFPKTRLLSKVYLHMQAVVNVKHATKTEIAIDELTPYRVIRRCAIDLNNGFSPYTVSGEELALLNTIDKNGDKVLKATNYKDVPEGKYVASPEGTDNVVDFYLELPITLNEISPTGIILLQNDQTNVTLNIDIANGVDMFKGVDVEGYTVTIGKVTGDVALETFSIPANENAMPDLSVLKLVNGRSESMPSVGQQIIKLSTGTIYRKLVVYITDEQGKPVEDADLTNIELVFNGADVNYNIAPSMLRAINTSHLGYELPKGVYIFDFSSGGNLPNFGNTRDFIDTEKLTEFWLRFTTSKRGNVAIVSECITRLNG